MYYADDALFAALKMAELLSARGVKLSELVDKMPRYESKKMEVEIDEKMKFRVIDVLRGRFSEEGIRTINIDGVKVMNGDGWFIIRASNTSPSIRIVAESAGKKGLERLVSYAVDALEKAKEEARRPA